MLSLVETGDYGSWRTCLTVPSETLEPFGFELIVEIFSRSYFGTRHGGG